MSALVQKLSNYHLICSLLMLEVLHRKMIFFFVNEKHQTEKCGI